MREIIESRGFKASGRIELVEGKLTARFDELPDVPGLYCLEFQGGTWYVGESSNLRRRIGDYLVYYSSTGIESEFRINKALQESKGADIFILVGEQLQSKSARCTLETSITKEAKSKGIHLRNGASIYDRIAFHAWVIAGLSEELAKRSRTTEEKS